jgi:hypothetical protein
MFQDQILPHLILTQRVPVAEQAKPRKIEIVGGDSDRKEIKA